MGDNKLAALDLAGLAGAPVLKKLVLTSNALKKLDVTPLASCKNLRVFKVDATVELSASAAVKNDLPSGLQSYADRIAWA